MKTVFFLASPAHYEQYKENYQLIINLLKKFGYTHTSDFTADYNNHFLELPKNKWSLHYKRTMDDLNKADITVFEVTISSLSIGQVLQNALVINKPVIALHTDKYNPIFLGGAEEIESKLQVVEYNLNNLEKELLNALDYAQNWLEFRFTMNLNNRLKNHLDKIAKNGKSRSDYIRELIIKDMKKARGSSAK